MPDTPLRQRFPRGCRVRFSDKARATFALRRDVPATVVGYGARHLWIRRDGNTSRESWGASYLERLEEDDA